MRLFALRGAKKRLKTPPRRRRRRITLRRKGFPRERLPTEGSPRQERDLRRERGLRHKRNLQPSSAADAAASARVRRHRGNACMSWYHKAHATPLPAHKRNRYGLPFRPCPHASARRAHTRPRWHGADERDTGRPRTREARFRKAHVRRTHTCKERAHGVRLRRAHIHGAGACRTRICEKRPCRACVRRAHLRGTRTCETHLRGARLRRTHARKERAHGVRAHRTHVLKAPEKRRRRGGS